MRSRSKTAVTQFDQGDAVAGDADLTGYFLLGEIELLAAVTNQAAEVAFETVRHGTFLSARDHSGGLGTIIEEVAAPTKEHCYIDDRLSNQLDQMAITWTTLR